MTQLGKLNYRNHRKITVIDGVIGHSGGFNIGQEYIDGKPKYPAWRDTGLRFEGPAVGEMMKLFADRWYEVKRESLYKDEYFASSLDPRPVRNPPAAGRRARRRGPSRVSSPSARGRDRGRTQARVAPVALLRAGPRDLRRAS